MSVSGAQPVKCCLHGATTSQQKQDKIFNESRPLGRAGALSISVEAFAVNFAVEEVSIFVVGICWGF